MAPKPESVEERLLRKRAKEGDREALARLGVFLRQQGRYKEGLPYVVKAAEKGCTVSMRNAGNVHFNGTFLVRPCKVNHGA
jgi:hypothetical protein